MRWVLWLFGLVFLLGVIGHKGDGQHAPTAAPASVQSAAPQPILALRPLSEIEADQAAAEREAVAAIKAGVTNAVRKGETVLGAWRDGDNPCGTVVLVRRAAAVLHFFVCRESDTGRVTDDRHLGNAISETLLPMTPPPGAVRAWQTAGLTQRREKVLGQWETIYTGPDGERYDHHRLVERADGTLEVYEHGIGLSDARPALRARPFPLD